MIVLFIPLVLGQATPMPGAGAFFREAAVDFWGDRKSAEAARAASEAMTSTETLWAEPMKLPDGRTTIYVPPKAVLGFLENPTRENATAYLAWQEARMKKLKAALALLRDIKAERTGPPSPESHQHDPDAPTRLTAPTVPGEILYFKKKGCPWCLEEDRALAAVLRARPDLKVRTIALEEAPELAKAFDVTVVPTLVIPARGGRNVVLRGFVPASRLLRVIEEVNRDGL